MSAEVPTPSPGMRRLRPPLLDSNRKQVMLFAALRRAVIGLRKSTVSSDGLDTFKLVYEFVRDEIGMRRDRLRRQNGHDDNVVVAKTAQSA